jgi:hypothetical protein
MPAVDALKQQNRGQLWSTGQLPGEFRAPQRRQISLVFGWSSMFGLLAFAGAAGTGSYAACRLKPLRWWEIGFAFGGSDDPHRPHMDDQPRLSSILAREVPIPGIRPGRTVQHKN